MWPSSCVTPAGTSNELDVQNKWEENTHNTHTTVIPPHLCVQKGAVFDDTVAVFDDNVIVLGVK